MRNVGRTKRTESKTIQNNKKAQPGSEPHQWNMVPMPINGRAHDAAASLVGHLLNRRADVAIHHTRSHNLDRLDEASDLGINQALRTLATGPRRNVASQSAVEALVERADVANDDVADVTNGRSSGMPWQITSLIDAQSDFGEELCSSSSTGTRLGLPGRANCLVDLIGRHAWLTHRAGQLQQLGTKLANDWRNQQCSICSTLESCRYLAPTPRRSVGPCRCPRAA